MSTSLKDSSPSPAVPVKGVAGSGNTPSFNSGYCPSGLLIATISKALREAQDNDLEMQQQQAEVERDEYKLLGGIGMADIHDGLLAMSADSIAQAGVDEADGLKAQGIANAINAGVSGATTIGAGVNGLKNWRESSNLDAEAKTTQEFGEKLKNSPDGDLAIGAQNKELDPEVESAIQKRVPKELQENREKYNAARMEAKGQLEDENEKQFKEIRRKQDDLSHSTQNVMNFNRSVTDVAQAATGTYSSFEQGQAKINSAADQASGQVQKQVQDMTYSNANTFKDQSKQSAQAALQTSETLAQVANSQVQFRG